jgi:hypothetical protein
LNPANRQTIGWLWAPTGSMAQDASMIPYTIAARQAKLSSKTAMRQVEAESDSCLQSPGSVRSLRKLLRLKRQEDLFQKVDATAIASEAASGPALRLLHVFSRLSSISTEQSETLPLLQVRLPAERRSDKGLRRTNHTKKTPRSRHSRPGPVIEFRKGSVAS